MPAAGEKDFWSAAMLQLCRSRAGAVLQAACGKQFWSAAMPQAGCEKQFWSLAALQQCRTGVHEQLRKRSVGHLSIPKRSLSSQLEDLAVAHLA